MAVEITRMMRIKAEDNALKGEPCRFSGLLPAIANLASPNATYRRNILKVTELAMPLGTSQVLS